VEELAQTIAGTLNCAVAAFPRWLFAYARAATGALWMVAVLRDDVMVLCVNRRYPPARHYLPPHAPAVLAFTLLPVSRQCVVAFTPSQVSILYLYVPVPSYPSCRHTLSCLFRDWFSSSGFVLNILSSCLCFQHRFGCNYTILLSLSGSVELLLLG
jgi:hypothetical protein